MSGATCHRVPGRARCYAVRLDNATIGWVWHTTSWAVWGSLSCTPRAKVWAYAQAGEKRPQGSHERRGGAVTYLVGLHMEKPRSAEALAAERAQLTLELEGVNDGPEG